MRCLPRALPGGYSPRVGTLRRLRPFFGPFWALLPNIPDQAFVKSYASKVIPKM
jgi:hypothetical protein